MTYYTFMMRYHKGEDSPEGNLARHIYQDKEKFPRNGIGKYKGWHKILRDYLEQQKASDTYLDVFERTWDGYVQHEKQRWTKKALIS